MSEVMNRLTCCRVWQRKRDHRASETGLPRQNLHKT